MSSRLILTAASAVFAVCGLAALFAPDVIGQALAANAAPDLKLVIQLLGGALFGFCLLDWFNRSTRIGGVYGRPLGLANLLFTGVTAVTLAKAMVNGTAPSSAGTVAAIFGVLAAGFGWLVFGPAPETT